jgi:nucleoside-diphosphate-sugar epimerase
MSRILALGGCGFIGSYVVRNLLSEGHEVTAVDNFSKYGMIKHDFYSNPRFKLIRADARKMTSSQYKDYDQVICFAALIGGISYFHRIPYSIAKVNTDILTNSIDCTLKGSPDAVYYYLSSSMVYERMKRPVTEEDALNQLTPITNYGMQKLFGEFVVRGAKQEVGLNYVIVRPFNAVGSGELPKVKSNGEVDFGMSHVIPDFIYKALVKQSPFEIFGDGKQVRTFTHAKDIADAMRLMVNKNVKNDDFNICGDATLDIGQLARLTWKKVNGDKIMPKIKYVPAPKDDVRFRVGVSKKAHRLLGWKPKYGIDYILDDTYGFIKENFKSLKR